jgi:hypothetical protein
VYSPPSIQIVPRKPIVVPRSIDLVDPVPGSSRLGFLAGELDVEICEDRPWAPTVSPVNIGGTLRLSG